MISAFFKLLLLANKLGTLILLPLIWLLQIIYRWQTWYKTTRRNLVQRLRRFKKKVSKSLTQKKTLLKQSFQKKAKTIVTKFHAWADPAVELSKKVISKLVVIGVLGFTIGLTTVLYDPESGVGNLVQNLSDLPSPQSVSDFPMPASTLIYDRNGILLYNSFNTANRVPVKLETLPKFLIDATIAAEDKRFYSHHGLDPVASLRAGWRNLTADTKQGGSTITQQVARSVFLSRQKTLSRKLSETIIAWRMEQNLTKNQILELYFNTVSYGGNSVGIEAAARNYFNKHAAELSDKEIIYLVSLTPAPSVYSRERQADNPQIRYVLNQMQTAGLISEAKQSELLAAPLTFVPTVSYKRAPHVVDTIISELTQKYGEKIFDQGLIVKSTIDLPTQNQFQQMVSQEVALHSRTYNFNNAAALVTDPTNGQILAMVGSADYFDPKQGQVNLTIVPRQLGSTMKIVPYSFALENGYNPDTTLSDTPITFVDYNDYTPRNYDHAFHGDLPLKKAFANSYNIPALKITHALGVSNVAQFGIKMGIDEFARIDQTHPPLSLAIGGVETSLYHLAQAYQIIANQGNKVSLSLIDQISDHQGQLIYQHQPDSTQIIQPQTAEAIFAILSDPKLRQDAFGRPAYFSFPKSQVALKSGTSNDLRDNVTVSFTPNFVVATWVGNNDSSSMRQVASGYSGASVIMHQITNYLLDHPIASSTKTTQNLAKGR